MKSQMCFLCDGTTGRTTGEDSLYCELCNDCGCDGGPFCEDCWERHKLIHKYQQKLADGLARIIGAATELAKNCPPAPHACNACEILHVARETMKEVSP